MDEHVRILLTGFMRTIRHSTDADNILEQFLALEEKSLRDPTTLTENERRLLLDLPDASEEAQNIAAITSSTRPDFLQNAASNPSGLSVAELEFLSNRLWRNVTMTETTAKVDPISTLLDLGDDVLQSAHERIQAAQAPAYAEHEKQAFDNAILEQNRRRQAERQQAHDTATGGPARISAARPWIQQLDASKDTRGSSWYRFWGFAAFVDSDVRQLGPAAFEEFSVRLGAVLFGVRINSGVNAVALDWRLQFLDDVEDTPSTINDDDEINVEALQAMSDAFTAINSRPLRQRNQNTGAVEGEGLDPGILSNTFLVINRRCVESVLSGPPWPDNKVILAVEHPPSPSLQNSSSTPGQYPGYMWVRLPQICHHFYEMRWLHAQEHPMSDLWRSAQPSVTQAFVSIDEREAQMFLRSPTSASAVP